MHVSAVFLDQLPSEARYLLYGAGELGRRVHSRMEHLGDAGMRVVGFLDGFRSGKYCGLPTYHPTELPGLRGQYDHVLLTLGSYRQALAQLQLAGLQECYLLMEEQEALRAELANENTTLSWECTRLRYQLAAVQAEHFGPPELPPWPPSDIPEAMRDAFTMQGLVPVVPAYDVVTRPSNYPLIYTDAEIDAYVRLVEARRSAYYGETDQWLYQALESFPIAGKKVLIIGSQCPWYESVCLAYGALPHVVDYGSIRNTCSRLRILSPDEAWGSLGEFDACLSISSIEHDGLGRYGDPVSPDGDMQTMLRTLTVLKPGGLLYLAMPVGSDALEFNHRRVYGRLRLPLVLEGWLLQRTFGYSEELLDRPAVSQPLFVLQKP